MRTLTIGDRQLTDLTKEEFGYFLYKFGHCGAEHFFEMPVFTEFEFDKIRSSDEKRHLSWRYIQKRKKDDYTVECNGFFHFYSMLRPNQGDMSLTRFRRCDPQDMDIKKMNLMEISYFIALGFDVPITDSKIIQLPIFEKYAEA